MLFSAPWVVPRTADGHPDLQGLWLNDTLTPLERPRQFAGQPYFSEAEARAYEAGQPQRNLVRIGEFEERLNGDVNEWGRVLPDLRTSLIVDPPDGRIPERSAAAQARVADRARNLKEQFADGPETFPLTERCILFGGGPPMMPMPYNNNVQIVQTRTHVMIHNEMVHDARVIPLDRRPHLPPSVRQWRGDPRGHWEGDSLVVETTNFTAKTAFAGSSEQLRLVERFTRVSADALQYEFTVDDPSSFSRPWTARSVMSRTAGPLYEYACHEGNYSLEHMLKGARAQDRDAGAKD